MQGLLVEFYSRKPFFVLVTSKVGTHVQGTKRLAKRHHLVRHQLVSCCNTSCCKSFFNKFILGLFKVDECQ